MQGHFECLAATFTPPGLLHWSLLVLVHFCLLVEQRLHKHPAFATGKDWVCVAGDGRFPDEQRFTEPWCRLAVGCAPRGAAVLPAGGVSKDIPGMLG